MGENTLRFGRPTQSWTRRDLLVPGYYGSIRNGDHATAGKPFDEADQMSILRASLRAFETMTTPGEIQLLPNAWGEDGWRRAAAATTGEDTRQPRDETPQFQFATDRAAALASGAFPAS